MAIPRRLQFIYTEEGRDEREVERVTEEGEIRKG